MLFFQPLWRAYLVSASILVNYEFYSYNATIHAALKQI